MEIWFYEEVVPDGDSFTPLFNEWTMTNFHIHNGFSGETSSEELETLINKNEVKRYCIQSGMLMDMVQIDRDGEKIPAFLFRVE